MYNYSTACQVSSSLNLTFTPPFVKDMKKISEEVKVGKS